MPGDQFQDTAYVFDERGPPRLIEIVCGHAEAEMDAFRSLS